MFGDSFGIINALFSGLAFGGVIVTILLQRQELSLQRKELESTRKEMENQGRIQERQSFESTFFQLLRTQNQILNDIDVGESKGRDAFVYFHRRLSKYYSRQDTRIEEQERILNSFKSFWSFGSTELAHYFRNLESILGFIDSGERPRPWIYTHILRNQLSNQETFLLFYYGIFASKEFENTYLKGMLESHGMFGELNTTQLLNVEHKSFYKDDAYGFGYRTSPHNSITPP